MKNADVLNEFENNRKDLLNDLRNTEAHNDIKETLSSFQLDKEAINTYINDVYNQAEEGIEEGACRDVIENGRHSLIGAISNIAKQFEHMKKFKNELGQHELKSRAEEMLKDDRTDGNERDRISKIRQNLESLHEEDTLGPTLEKPESLDRVQQNLAELEVMLEKLS